MILKGNTYHVFEILMQKIITWFGLLFYFDNLVSPLGSCFTIFFLSLLIVVLMMMNFIDKVLFKAPKALYIESIIRSHHIHTGGGELHHP